jgi:hypothetical protein
LTIGPLHRWPDFSNLQIEILSNPLALRDAPAAEANPNSFLAAISYTSTRIILIPDSGSRWQRQS